jgi:cGMP-dependent protein kinase
MSKVYLVCDKEKNYHTLKCFEKCEIVKKMKEPYLINEKATLDELVSPFIVCLHRTFKDEHRIYFLEEFVNGEPLINILKVLGVLDVEDT